jgi:imidazole glycerol-phosphate synthase subunit HisH
VIAILDYGVNNLASVVNAFRAVGAAPVVTADPSVIRQASALVLPGVGAASVGMRRLRERGLEEPIQEAAAIGRPILGLCLGMQLLFAESEEGNTSCLGLLAGRVTLLRGDIKVPHIGWNQVALREDEILCRDLPPNPYFYFVHSYICEPDNPAIAAGTTDYGHTFCSLVKQDSIWGTQFHPERSGRSGLNLLRNFSDLLLLHH